MTLQRVAIPSPNYSSRGGSAVRLIVVHTAEGATTYQSLGNYFASSASQVSSHVGIDDTPGVVGEYVRRDYKAWTAANANPYSVQAELCAFAAWTDADWNAHPVMLQNTAEWVAEEAAAYGIPLVRLSAGQAQDGHSRGVCEHVDLGVAGGNHWDCGTPFPLDSVLAMAGGQPAPTPGPTPPPPSPGTAPPWPYGPSDYIGQPDPDPCCHSGCYGGADQANVATWQAQMAARGWSLSADGCYGPESQGVCEQFQTEKGLTCDGLVGPNTWSASWTEPVT
jgi:hypothetical protein